MENLNLYELFLASCFIHAKRSLSFPDFSTTAYPLDTISTFYFVFIVVRFKLRAVPFN